MFRDGMLRCPGVVAAGLCACRFGRVVKPAVPAQRDRVEPPHPMEFSERDSRPLGWLHIARRAGIARAKLLCGQFPIRVIHVRHVHDFGGTRHQLRMRRGEIVLLRQIVRQIEKLDRRGRVAQADSLPATVH